MWTLGLKGLKNFKVCLQWGNKGDKKDLKDDFVYSYFY